MEPLDDLLIQLGNGDSAAAEQVFLTFEPYLRKAIRRHMPPLYRVKFDSVDVLQSIWADLLRGFRDAGWRFADADQLRGFLFVATRNRLRDRLRQHRRAAESEQPLCQTHERHFIWNGAPAPSELAQASDLWEHLLMQCPVEHRPVLELRRQGYTFSEIASRMALHPDSIRRILRNLARGVAFASGGRNEPATHKLHG